MNSLGIRKPKAGTYPAWVSKVSKKGMRNDQTLAEALPQEVIDRLNAVQALSKDDFAEALSKLDIVESYRLGPAGTLHFGTYYGMAVAMIDYPGDEMKIFINLTPNWY